MKDNQTAEEFLIKHSQKVFVHGEPLRGMDFTKVTNIEVAREYAIRFAIEQLEKLRNIIVVEPKGNLYDDDVAAVSSERGRCGGIINERIRNLQSKLTP